MKYHFKIVWEQTVDIGKKDLEGHNLEDIAMELMSFDTGTSSGYRRFKVVETYPKKCKCGGTYKKGIDIWPSRIRCAKCGDYYDL